MANTNSNTPTTYAQDIGACLQAAIEEVQEFYESEGLFLPQRTHNGEHLYFLLARDKGADRTWVGVGVRPRGAYAWLATDEEIAREGLK